MSTTFAHVLRIDAELARAGHHPLTPWWRGVLERFYAHSTAHTFVGRVGRGGAKSHTSTKVALTETLLGTWAVPPGERHFWAFASTNKDEAAQRLLLLQSFLKALGVGFDVAGDTITLRDLPRGFRVFAAQVGAVSGFRCYGYSADELAKWMVGSANPAPEICSSLNAMCVTHPGARKLLISSPFGELDYHYERFERGDTADQVVAHAASWIANPDGITEAQTHDAEPCERVWSREYAAIPGDTITANWFGDRALALATAPIIATPQPPRLDPALPRMIKHAPQCARETGWLRPGGCNCEPFDGYGVPIGSDVKYTVAIDQAFQHDRFAWAVASSQLGDWDDATLTRGPRITRIHSAGSWKPDRSPREMARRVLHEICLPHHTREAAIDQHGGLAFLELCKDVGLKAKIVPWTGGDGETSKATRYRAVRLAMLEGAFRIPNEPDLVREFRSVRGTLLPSGGERIEVPRSALGHGDRIAAIVLAGSITLAGYPQLPASKRTWQEEYAAEAARERFEQFLSGI